MTVNLSPTPVAIVSSSTKVLAAEELRRLIIHGKIVPGAKVTEREVGRVLGIGRMPARDALMLLEHDGLVMSRSGARHVIELSEQRIRSIYDVRRPLEVLAATQAAASTNVEGRRRLDRCLSDLRRGCDEQDPELTTPADLALHREIWLQSGNPDLLRIMTGMQALFFVLVMQGTIYGPRSWERLYESHRVLVEAVNSGKGALAGRLIDDQLVGAVGHSLKVGKIVPAT